MRVPLYEHFDLVLEADPERDLPRQVFSVAVIAPTVINDYTRFAQGLSAAEYYEGSGQRIEVPKTQLQDRLLRARQEETQELLKRIHEFAKARDFASGLYDGNTLPPMVNELDFILSGEMPIVAIFEFQNPDKILQTLSIAYPDKSGKLPVDYRLQGLIYDKPLSPSGLHLDFGPVTALSPRSPSVQQKIWSRVMGIFPRWSGLWGELKVFVRSENTPFFWGGLITRLLVANQFSRKVDRKVPSGYYVDPNLAFIRKRYERLRSEFLASKLQPYALLLDKAWVKHFEKYFYGEIYLDKLIVQAVSPGTQRLYERTYGFPEIVVPSFPDPHVKGRISKVLGMTPQHFETMMIGKLLDLHAPKNPARRARLEPGFFGSIFYDPKVCGHIIQEAAAEFFPRLRPWDLY